MAAIDYSKWDAIVDSDSDEEEPPPPGGGGGFPRDGGRSVLDGGGAVSVDVMEAPAGLEQGTGFGGFGNEMLTRFGGMPPPRGDRTAQRIAAKTPPREWPWLGHVQHHPDDVCLEMYPKRIFEADPATFVPAPRRPGDIVRNWGLDDDDYDRECDAMHPFMRNVNIHNQGLFLYADAPSPLQQFIRVLEVRKLAAFAPSLAARRRTLVVHIALNSCEDRVWRRFKVPASARLAALHDQVLIPITGFSRAYHGYAFADPRDGAAFGPDERKNGGYNDLVGASRNYLHLASDANVPLGLLLRGVDDTCVWTYDLMDKWAWTLRLEAVEEPPQRPLGDDAADAAAVSAADAAPARADDVVLIDGRGACPPEDSNGLDGKGGRAYADFLRAFSERGPNSGDVAAAIAEVEASATNYVEDSLTGAPRRFRPDEYDLAFHRAKLDRFLAGPRVKRRGSAGANVFKETHAACAQCHHRLSVLRRCAGCGAVKYCSTECQTLHWPTHKPHCRRAKKKKKQLLQAASDSSS